MEDEKRLKRLMAKDPEKGFELLLSLYGGVVKAVCRNILFGFSTEDIEDAAADCFVEFWRSRDRIINSVTVRGYIIGIAKNTAYTRLKQMIRIPYPAQLEDMELGIDIDMTSEASRRINAEIIQKVINSMPEPEREIFIRRYYYCERVSVIAEAVGCSEKKVENILYRYKNKLKERLTEGGIIL